ncbi:MAG: hypothetical protein CSA76_06600, partial [Spirochaetales bacterium]
MEDRKEIIRAIDEKQAVIAEEQTEEEQLLTVLGEALYNARSGAGTDTDKTGKLNFTEAGRQLDEIQKLEKSLGSLRTNEGKRQSLSDESRALKLEARNIKNRLDSLFTDLGKASWEVWKSGTSVPDELRDALADLIKNDSKRRAADDKSAAADSAEDESANNESADNNTEESGEKRRKPWAFLAQGRSFLRNTKRKTAGVIMDWQWGKAGRRVWKTVAPELLANTSAESVLAGMKKLQARQEAIAGREAALAEQLSSLDSDLAGMPGKGSARKRGGSMERMVESRKKELQGEFLILGRSYVEGNTGALNPENQAVKKALKAWKEVSSRIQKKQEEADILCAHKALLESQEEIKIKAGKISRLEEEVKSRQARIRALKKELKAL